MKSAISSGSPKRGAFCDAGNDLIRGFAQHGGVERAWGDREDLAALAPEAQGVGASVVLGEGFGDGVVQVVLTHVAHRLWNFAVLDGRFDLGEELGVVRTVPQFLFLGGGLDEVAVNRRGPLAFHVFRCGLFQQERDEEKNDPGDECHDHADAHAASGVDSQNQREHGHADACAQVLAELDGGVADGAFFGGEHDLGCCRLRDLLL